MNLSKREAGFLLAEVLIIAFCIWGLFGKNASWNWSDQMFSESVVSDDQTTSEVNSTNITLQPGVYKVQLQYDTADDMVNAWSVHASDASYGGLKANACMLYSGLHNTDMYIWLSETEQVYVTVTTASGSQVTVHETSITQTNAAFRMSLTVFLFLFGMIDLVYMMNKKRPITKKEKTIAFLLGILIVAASIPILNGYEIAGADTIYHLLRIEGVKDGLLSGQFPVRIQPNWLQGYGYATGIFYSDTYLYIPAILRIIGFPVGTCFLLYKFMVNIATVLIAYFSFKAIFKDRMAGLLGSALYTLNIYRLLIMYLKDHLGEYTAMAFLPLLAYSVWRLLQKDTDDGKYRRTWIPFAISITALVQCHILSCEMAGLTTIVILLIGARRTFRKETMLEIGKTAIAVILLNLWFIVPFLDYMKNANLIITGDSVYTRAIQGHGAAWPMLFGLIQVAGHSDNDISGGMQQGMPFTLGAALLLGVVYFVYLFFNRDKFHVNEKRWHLGIIGVVGGLFTIWMASAYFPWDAIQNSSWLTQRLVSAIQYPTRWLEIAAIFLSIASCAAFMIGRAMISAKSVRIYTAVTTVVLCVAVGLFFSELLLTSGIYKIYEEDAMGNAYLSGREYLPEGTDENMLKAGQVICSDQLTISSYEKDNLHINFDYNNENLEEGYVEVPLLAYKGYQAYDTVDGSKLEIEDGDNHVVRVIVPGDKSGHIELKFVSPFYWRVSEVISFISLLFFAGLLVKIYLYKERTEGK